MRPLLPPALALSLYTGSGLRRSSTTSCHALQPKACPGGSRVSMGFPPALPWEQKSIVSCRDAVPAIPAGHQLQ